MSKPKVANIFHFILSLVFRLAIAVERELRDESQGSYIYWH